ncbi:hypothetical protein BX600DRAFT_511889 [Xylariales sp. PMI_506]|nr:hypothetical protein BX600DRAFT_511889 [Xylariales sp. PMI_506]
MATQARPKSTLVTEFPCHPPPGSLATWYTKSDFVDSFAVRLPATATGDARVLARLMFGNLPRFFYVLMWIRDAVVRCFGVKTSGAIRSQDDGRGRIDFFPVISESVDEVVVGEDDKHLDFRASVGVIEASDGGGERLCVMTTVVRRHNLFGRLYLWTILPFHRGIVTYSLRRLGDRLSS